MITLPELESLSGIGFRHMLEDGLAIVISDAELPSDRRQYVLHDLAGLFDEARKGSDVSRREDYYFDPTESTALRSFVFVERHLSQEGLGSLSPNLATACKVLRAIMDDTAVEQADRQIAGEILRDMLTSVELRGGIGLPEEPQHLDWDE